MTIYNHPIVGRHHAAQPMFAGSTLVPGTAQVPMPYSAPPTLEDKILSILTPDEIATFQGMLEKFKKAFGPQDIAALQGMGVDLLTGSPSIVSLAGNALVGGMLAQSTSTALADNLAEVDIPPEGIRPGYNALDWEMAVGLVADFLDGNDLPEMTDNHIGSPSPRRKTNFVIEARYDNTDRVSAMLAGATSPTAWSVTDGLMHFDVTQEDVANLRLTEAGRLRAGLSPYSNIGNYVTVPAYQGSAWYQGAYHADPLQVNGKLPGMLKGTNLPDGTDHITGLSAEAAVAMAHDTDPAGLEIIQESALVPQITVQELIKLKGLNPLTGVPDPVPDEVAHIKISVDALQDMISMHGEKAAQSALDSMIAAKKLLPAPVIKTHTDTYTPPVPVSQAMTLGELIAEVERTKDFSISHFHPGDSEITADMYGLLASIAPHNPISAQDMIYTKQILIDALTKAHAVQAVPVSLTRQQSFQVSKLPPVTSWPTNSTTINTASTSGSGQSNYVIASSFYGGARVGAPHPFEPGQIAFDRTFKLQPNHQYLMDDGGKIEIDAVGNYTVIDKDAKITYRATRMREFNRYVNGSDLIGDFIEDLGRLGANQDQAAGTPIEMFIRWLVFKAAEHDNEEPPEDVPPLTADEMGVDLVQMAEAIRA